MSSRPMTDRDAKVISNTAVEPERIELEGFQRTVTKLLETTRMTVHVATFDPQQAGSRHVHPNSEEVTYIISGAGSVTVGTRTLELSAGDLFYGPPNVPHQFRNTTNEPLVLFSIYSPPDELPLYGNLPTANDEA